MIPAKVVKKLNGPHTDTWTGLGWTSKELPPMRSGGVHRKAASIGLLKPPGLDPRPDFVDISCWY